ncbi:putative alpha-amylase [Talaromyces proteolyticus]|uniref:Alpha-amylase n=1 Tax=Talaromyces proteolyticus TaxID=1131652 RepID=A0AAD4KRP3_9EURO|nr:putative alpha-amylase [Talaromyces proteolyticus]KAH8698915.1 putative alpha-amylase [Talaromyces proteolyticus]
MNFLFSCFSRQREQEPWKEIEDEARNIEELPSWHSSEENFLMMEAFEWYVPHDGRHWQRLQLALRDLKEIGIDNLLLPPGCKAMNPSGNGYDIYDLFDLGEFDQKGSVATKWGTKEDLIGLAKMAQVLDMGILWDAVLNHKAGADHSEKCLAVTVEPEDRNIDLTKPQEINAWVGFDFPGRGEKYSRMKYHWQHFNAIDYNSLDKKKAIYKIFAPGKDWAKDVSTENGNYDYLMFANLDHSNPEVRQDILDWVEWIGNQLPLSGMRLDAVKHYSSGFQKTLVDRIRQTVGKDWFIVSEFWSGKIQELKKYMEQVDYKVHLFDAPLCNRLSDISQTRGADLRLIFDKTLVDYKPEHAVTFVMNHDTQPSQALEAPVAPFFKPIAYALILLRKQGQPCIFYGDLYGITAGGKRSPPEPPSCNGRLPALTLARKLYAYGEQRDYFSRKNCIGFVRYGNARHPWGMACVLSNGPRTKKKMFVGKKHAKEKWTDVLELYPTASHVIQTHVTIDSKGYGVFPVSGMSVSVWVNAKAAGRDRFEKHL